MGCLLEGVLIEKNHKKWGVYLKDYGIINFCCCILRNFLKKYLLFVCLFAGSVKDSGNIFMQSFPLYTPHLFSMLSNGDIVDIENPDEIFSPTFAVDKYSRLLLHLSIFLNKHSRSA